MKIFKLLFSSFLVFAINPIIQLPDLDDLTFSMTPLSQSGETSYFSFTIKFVKTTATNRTITISLKNDSSNDRYTLYQETLTDAYTYYSKSFTYNNKQTRISNTIYIDIVDGINSLHVFHDAEVRSHKLININKENFQSESYSNILMYKKSTWETVKENYSFSNFSYYNIPSYYHYLDLSSYRIKYSDSGFMPECGEILLYLTNRDHLFDDMPNNGGYVLLPLKMVGLGNKTFSLKLKNTYYVHPMTLKMSSTLKDEYVSTSYLYLPRNEMRYQGEYDGTIVFKNLGIDSAKYTFNFKLNALLNLMGDCVNSEYCVLNIDEEVNE